METFVYWLRITEFILNNTHCTQNDRLAALLHTEQRLELQQGSYIGSLRGIEARASMARERLIREWTKHSGTFDLHSFCLLVQHVIFSNFLSTISIIHASCRRLVLSVFMQASIQL